MFVSFAFVVDEVVEVLYQNLVSHCNSSLMTEAIMSQVALASDTISAGTDHGHDVSKLNTSQALPRDVQRVCEMSSGGFSRTIGAASHR